MKEELKTSSKNLEALSAENARLASTLAQSSKDLAKVKAKVDMVKSELEPLHTLAVSLQGPMIKASLYKLMRTQGNGNYVNSCTNALNLVAMIDTVELISVDFPELDIRKTLYGYNEEARKKFGWLQVKAMLRVPNMW